MWGCFCCCCCKNGSQTSVSQCSNNSSTKDDDEKSVVIYEATLISQPASFARSSSPTFESFSSGCFDPNLSIASESIAEVSESGSETTESEKSENTVIFKEVGTPQSAPAELIFHQDIDLNSKVHHQSLSGKLCTTMYRQTYPFVFSTAAARKIHLLLRRHSFVFERP